MGLGFYALVQTVEHAFGAAAVAIMIGHVLDILDGRVARLTKTTSRFGVELDSLADWMTFCIAPAFLMHEMVLRNMEHNRSWAFPLALLFVVCGGLRLAKFNLKAQLGESKGSYFSGLPTPASGGMLAIFALLYDVVRTEREIKSFPLLMNQVPMIYKYVPALMLLLSLLMVSEIRFTTFKQINLLRPRSMRALVLTVLAVLMILIYPQNTIFILYVSYITWGLVSYFLRLPLRRDDASRGTGETGYQVDHYGK
jgi:CDP-diacylglycerol--serine O-phosphatidyltransferase